MGRKRIICCLLLLLWLAPYAHAAPSPEIFSEAAVVLDLSDGEMLYGKNPYVQKYPASITKILTCAIALQEGDVNAAVTASKTAVSVMSGATTINMQAGEQMSLNDALHATALRSANDAANVVAEHIAGSIEAFAEKMNQFAVKAGALESSFMNPSGLSHDRHYTTAYDMALIAKACAQVPGFKELFGTLDYTIPKTDLSPERKMETSNQLLLPEKAHYYSYTICSKSGWTTPAQHTLVSFAEKEGVQLVCVVLKSEQTVSKYLDTIALFDHCFNNYEALKSQANLALDIPGGDVLAPMDPVRDHEESDGETAAVSGAPAPAGGDYDFGEPLELAESLPLWFVFSAVLFVFLLISLVIGLFSAARHKKRRTRGKRVMR